MSSIVGMAIGLIRVEFGSAVFCADTVVTLFDVITGILTTGILVFD